MRRYSCLQAVTYAAAMELCSRHKFRVCTLDELNLQCGTGCGFDEERVWTSTPC